MLSGAGVHGGGGGGRETYSLDIYPVGQKNNFDPTNIELLSIYIRRFLDA